MRRLFTIAICLSLSACAGLDVTWQLQANYISKELAAKRQAEALQSKADAQAAEDRARNERRVDEILRAKMP